MPGLIDAHNHAMGASMSKANLYLKNPNDKETILLEIKAYADANPDLPYIRGEAWNLGVFPENSPRKELLDAIDSKRPIYFYSQTGHSAWVNSKALELIGINAETKQTKQFIWDVDPDTKEPTGTIREYAMAALEQVLEPIDPKRMAPALQETLETFSEYGYTSLKLAEGEVPWVQSANLLDRQGKLNVRLFPSWFHRAHSGAMTADESRDVGKRWKEFVSPMVYPRYVKMYYDGSPDSYTSLMLEDYEGRPGFKGSTHFSSEEFIKDFKYFNSLGLGLIVHVFGDGTSLEAIKAFEAVRRENGDNGTPLHFSHSVLTQPREIARLARISDVSMDFITLAYPHPAIEGSFMPPIGRKRYQSFLNVLSAEEAGIPYGLGSDWPASLEPIPNGFFNVQSFVTRRNPSNPTYGTLNADQAISLEQAIRATTLGGAECLGFDWPDKLGSIEKGKLADFIVLDRNIFEIPTNDLKNTLVERTVVGGRVVFDRDEAEAGLDVVEVKITNADLDNAVDAAELNLLVEDELYGGGCGCFGQIRPHQDHPGAASAPEEVNLAFGALSLKGYHFARPAREIYWKNTDSKYWIQWTLKDDATVLWAYDPEAKNAVEILKVREK